MTNHVPDGNILRFTRPIVSLTSYWSPTATWLRSVLFIILLSLAIPYSEQVAATVSKAPRQPSQSPIADNSVHLPDRKQAAAAPASPPSTLLAEIKETPPQMVTTRGRGCPVEPPCYCDTRQQDTKPPRHYVHRISCSGPFFRNRKRFPRFVETGEAVEHLSLSYSGLTVLPNLAFRSIKVVNLDLQGNDFADRVEPKAFAGRSSKTLLAVNLAWSNITQLPRKVFRGLVMLRNISLAENKLRRLSSFIFQDLRSLEKLSMAGNELVELPADIFRYQANMRSLDLGYCSLERLPWNVFNGLWNLQSVDLRGNNIHHLEPYSFSDLFSLHTLLLSHNPLRRLQAKVFHGLTNLKVLQLEESSLEKIDHDAFKEVRNVETLDLGDNRLKFLPLGALLIPSLRRLSLDGNLLTQIPYEVTYLLSLRHLDVSYNRIETVDSCLLANQLNLEYLNLRENPFRCDCTIFWLRGLKNKLMSKWADKKMSLPFVPGKCATPASLRGIPITSWLDLECLRSQSGNANKCNRI